MTLQILIGTDGSDDALAAARRAAEVLASDAAIHLICVAEPPAVTTAGMESGFAGGMASPQAVDAPVAAADVVRTAPAVDAANPAGNTLPSPVLADF